MLRFLVNPPISSSQSPGSGRLPTYKSTNHLLPLFHRTSTTPPRDLTRDTSSQCPPSRRSCLPNCSTSTTAIGRRTRYLASDSPWRRCQVHANTNSLLSLAQRSLPSCTTRSGVRMLATLCRIRAPISHYTRLYTKYNNGRVSEELGKRGTQSRAERVATYLGKANVASDAGRSRRPPRLPSS